MLKRFIPKTPQKAREMHCLIHQIRAKNTHFGGVSLIALIFAIGGCIFTLDIQKQTLSRTALGLGGAALFLHGVSIQIDRTTDKMIDDLVEIIATGK